ncbi:hypothetical protein H072_2981 [Dactylellina haptotyla CBS 200.50]|uniref:Uncharacterized protein n=1 Tax=Dactylellina haptotyla (strain CBS 200.50) TaxID=1284197 RepID=S8APH9_DACHA|nr:hypothetical protein H072_2981 [Dactylellina haptotyla CBS 200.50]
MKVGILERFHPNSGLRQWSRTRTFAGTSKPHSLYVCGFRRKNFYKLIVLIILTVLAIALAIGIGVSNRVKRIRAQRNGIVGANGSHPGVTIPGSKIFVPTTTRTVQDVTQIGDKIYTIQYGEPEGVTYALSRGSIIPATSYLALNTDGPATFTFRRIITATQGDSTQIQGGTTSIIGPTATLTSSGKLVIMGSSTIVVGATTRVSSGSVFNTFTSIPYTVTGSASYGASSSSVKVLIYNDPGGGVIVVPADQSTSSRRFVTLSSASSVLSPASTPPQSTTNIVSSSASVQSSNSPYSTLAPSSSGAGGSNPAPDQTFSGDATFYDPGLGSCGIVNSGSDLIAAIGHALFDSQATANSNNNPFCGRQIIVRNKGGFNRRSNDILSNPRYSTFNTTYGPWAVTTFATSITTKLTEIRAQTPLARKKGYNGNGNMNESPL